MQFDERSIVSAAEPNPKHRPVFKGKGRVWKAVKHTARRTLITNPKVALGKILPKTAGLESLPRWDYASIATSIFGLFGVGASGAGVALATDAVANMAKVNTASGWYAPVKDVARLVGEGILGLKVYPWAAKELTGDANIGKAMWFGGTILVGVDLGITVFKYVTQGVQAAQGKITAPAPAAPAAATTGLALVGLSGLDGLIKGVGNLYTSPTTESIQSQATVEGLDGIDGSAIVEELETEKRKFHELSSLLKGDAGVDNLIRGVGTMSGAHLNREKSGMGSLMR